MCTAEEKQSALDRVLQSRTFHRSEQLRSFLRFVCEAELQGRVSDVNEYVIGVEVLGRPQGYSPAEDSSVRTRAYELRQKLEKLYTTELRNDPVHIALAKGSYVPQYTKPSAEAPAEAADAIHQDRPLARPPLRPKLIGSVVLLLLGAGVGAGVSLLLNHPSVRPPVDPVLLEAWRPMWGLDANVLLCAATPLHLVAGPEGHQAYGSPTFPAPLEAYPLFRQHRPLAPGAKLGLIFTDNVLGVGTMNAVVSVANTLHALGSSYQILPERVATLSALRGRNAFLFGAPVDSEAITRTMEHTALTVDYEPSVKEFVIRDRPSGKMIVPQKDANGDFVEVYGLVTVLNTRDSDRGRLGMVVFSGITSAGTHGAAEFFSSPRSLRNLRTILAREGVKTFPPAYQVVVRCTFNNSLLVAYEYHSHRILQRE